MHNDLKTIKICLRCENQPLNDLLESDGDIIFYECPCCKRHYAIRPGQHLHDRWGSPISLVLYPVIFSRDPRERAEDVAKMFLESTNEKELSKIVEEIERELNKPTQKVTQILDLAHSPTEAIVRDFLKKVSKIIKKRI